MSIDALPTWLIYTLGGACTFWYLVVCPFVVYTALRPPKAQRHSHRQEK